MKKYGIVFNSLTLLLWVCLVKKNFDKFQIAPTTPVKIALTASILLVCITILNLVIALQKLKNK